ncbi:hypothetical protein Tcan_17893 [Toxocara canis]|uniref:C2H2-type domain-containing protein n=1 Tax=Toxocara canis TaxID=6265 RepID=A0A0B2UYY0_TOXCA|nr:hypothetical protein Tcan_17893 [Toxocara canis]
MAINLSPTSVSTRGAASSSSSRSERPRDDFAFPARVSMSSRSFHSQPMQQTTDILDLWPNGEAFNVGINGYGIGSTMFPNMASPPQLSVVYLRCAECGIGKTSSEEMEVHIKMEHLQWLPFQCPICSAERASDLQMREHIHSAHRKNSNKFIYVDNPSAKRLLQILMDRSLTSARRPNASGVSQIPTGYGNNGTANGATTARERHFNNADEAGREEDDYIACPPYPRLSDTLPFQRIQEGIVSGTSSPPTEPRVDSPLRNLAALTNGRDHHTPPVQAPSATATVVSRKRPASRGIEAALAGHSNTDALLSAIRAATQETGEEHSTDEGSPLEEAFDEDEDGIVADSVAQMFVAKKRTRSELDTRDDSALQTDEALLGATGGGTEESHDPADILGNVAAMFNAEDVDVNGMRRRGINGVYTSARSKTNSSSVSKKRVLGECSKCKKPVTAGARQMHMFYHLGKDCNIYRFKCKYPNCDVEHYRKDQMENHHSKQHGKIDPALMEDRTAELFNSCQELSMQLLGTTGNTPGPTAAKAQLAYNASLAAQAQNQHKKKKKNSNIELPSSAPPVISPPPAEPKLPPPTTVVIDATSKFAAEHPEEQTLECRLCHKLMYNRIRGFHILWHMAKDLGINRYACKFCEFGHDRSQSVQTHGKREHGVEDCVEDRIEEYSDEVKSMSEACFGFQALFSQDSRRRSKIPIALPRAEASDDVNEGSEGDLSGEHNEDEEEIEDHDHERDADHESNEQHETNDEERLEEDQKEDELQEALQPVAAPRTPIATVVKSATPSTPKSETRSSVPSVSSSSSSHRSRKTKNRRFGIRKPPSRLKRKEMARLREMSMKLGGAQYFKKRINEAAHCEKCGVLTASRMSDHAYRHMDAQLFLCPHCDLGNQSRELVVRHIRDMHDSTEHPIDDRLKYAAEIKEMIRQCYPAYFIDAPIPTAADIEKLHARYISDYIVIQVHAMGLGEIIYTTKPRNKKCGVLTASRMSDHAYRHMDAQLFLCPHCDLGNQSRELVVRHIRDMHDSTEHPIDDRLKYAAEIKEMIRQCYPAYFIDAPIPTAADIEKLKASLAMDTSNKGEQEETPEDEGNEHEADDGEHDTEESGDEGDAAGEENMRDEEETVHEEDETAGDEGEEEHIAAENEDDAKDLADTVHTDGEEDEEIEAEM